MSCYLVPPAILLVLLRSNVNTLIEACHQDSAFAMPGSWSLSREAVMLLGLVYRPWCCLLASGFSIGLNSARDMLFLTVSCIPTSFHLCPFFSSMFEVLSRSVQPACGVMSLSNS